MGLFDRRVAIVAGAGRGVVQAEPVLASQGALVVLRDGAGAATRSATVEGAVLHRERRVTERRLP